MKRGERGTVWAADTESTQPRTLEIETGSGTTEEKKAAILALAKTFTTRIWAVGFGKIGDSQTCVTTDPAKMFDAVAAETAPGTFSVVYFHNLGWDGMLLLTWLYRERGYTYQTDRRFLTGGQLSTLIDDSGKWYSLTLVWGGAVIELRDSMKIIPTTIERMPKDFGLNVQKLKGSIDYTTDRPEGWEITPVEYLYITHDVKILQLALAAVEPFGLLDALTIGGVCVKKLKELVPNFSKLFPVLPPDIDAFCRRAYRGGWCYVNPVWQDRPIHPIGTGTVVDVNSLYPYAMHSAHTGDVPHRYPVGLPVADLHSPAVEDALAYLDEDAVVGFYEIECMFHVKPGAFPFLQLKRSRFGDTEYVRDTGEDPVQIWLTSQDLRMMLATYDVTIIAVSRVLVFACAEGVFDPYIDYYMTMKAEATRSGNRTMRTIAKLLLNNAYGKFGTNADADSQIITWDPVQEALVISTIEGEKPTVYVPVAAFCTAYGRAVTVTAANAEGANFMYADTDSLHLFGDAVHGMRIHPTDLGAWDRESDSNGGVVGARYVHQKCYIELMKDGTTVLRAGGCPETTKQRLLYDVQPFEPLKVDEDGKVLNRRRDGDELLARYTHGLTESGKLLRTRVSGGFILTNTTFTIK